MASITTQRDDPATPAERIAPVRADQLRAALAFLLTGQALSTAGAVDGFLRFAREHNLPLDQFWAAWRNDQPAAACLLLPSAGRTAMAFISPIAGPSQTSLTTRVINAAVERYERSSGSLIQALIEEHQELEQRALIQAGFIRLATLRYMDRIADMAPSPLTGPLEKMRLVHYRQDLRRAFAEAILATYERTRDCPALVGMRDIDDIIAGHMAVGRFDPQWWFAFYEDDKPAAVMLLAETPKRQAYELVYLGVAADFRGKGLARDMLRHGLGMVSQQARRQRPNEPSRICLAVDDENTPAVRLYEGLGFQANARKVALVKSLGA